MVDHGTSHELDLLLTIARSQLCEEEKRILANLLAGPLDWNALRLLAVHHGLEPLLYLHLHATADSPVYASVPAEAVESLHAACTLIAGRSLKLAAKLGAISAHLQGQGIPHIVYKGPLLAEQYYGNCALRAYRDLDLIVTPDQLIAARDALAAIGFHDKAGLSSSQQAASFKLGFEHPFSAEGGVDLDLHWRLVQRFKSRSVDLANMWKRATMVGFWGGEVPGFCPEDLLVVLCLHAGHHGWMHISQLCDIAQLLRAHPSLDWEIVRSHLGDSNTRRMVYVSLYLVHEYWGIEMPAPIVSMIRQDAHVARLSRRIHAEIWPAVDTRLTTSSLGWLLDRTAGIRAADRLCLLAGSVFCPAVEDFETFRLPLFLAPLYSVLRPLRLARKVAGAKHA
jgi:hypothetical protein